MNSGVGQMIRQVIGTIIEVVGTGVDWISEKLGGMVNFLLGIYQKMLEFMSMIPGAIGDMAGAGAENVLLCCSFGAYSLITPLESVNSSCLWQFYRQLVV